MAARYLLVLVVGLGAGFLLGRVTVEEKSAERSDRESDRREARSDPAGGVDPQSTDPASIRLPNGRTQEGERPDGTNTDPKRKARATADASGGSDGLLPGQRRKDGTIAGGARWPQSTENMAVSYMAAFIEAFIKEAKLSDAQAADIRRTAEQNTRDAVQLFAEYVNGELNGDQVYESLNALMAREEGKLRELVSEEQFKAYENQVGKIRDHLRTQITQTEITNLRTSLKLDPEQVKKIEPLVSARYNKVLTRSRAIPNWFFHPVRRSGDRDIYDASATEIRSYLRPDQAKQFDALERDAAAGKGFERFRSMLVPR